MKVLFVYPSPILGEQPLGVLYIASIFKEGGHQTELFDLTNYRVHHALGIYNGMLREFRDKAKKFDQIAFSCDSTQYPLAVKMANYVRDLKKTIWIGGAHPTVDPNNIDEVFQPWVFTGECETKFTKYVNSKDIDDYPWPDRSLLKSGILLNKNNGTSFITSRGCPFKCSYCINEFLRENYGSTIRYRDPEKVIEEIKYCVDMYGIKKVTFSDECFTLRPDLTSFLTVYKEEIGLPFLCQSHINVTTPKKLDALKDAGCELISFGLESGNTDLRKDVLGRETPDNDIRNIFEYCRNIGLKIGSFNMIGLPTETEEQIWDTINMNRELQPNHVMCTILAMYKGTEMRRIREHSVNNITGASYYKSVSNNMSGVPDKRLMAYAQLFERYVRYRRGTNILRKVMERLPMKLIPMAGYVCRKLL